MAWGGSLNKEGSDHIRELQEADKVIKFLEKFKEKLNKEQEANIIKVIDIIVKHFTQEQ